MAGCWKDVFFFVLFLDYLGIVDDGERYYYGVFSVVEGSNLQEHEGVYVNL